MSPNVIPLAFFARSKHSKEFSSTRVAIKKLLTDEEQYAMKIIG